MEAAHQILKRMYRNKRRNSWWLKVFVKWGGPSWLLIKRELTPQAVGVWLNPITSNSERLRILKRA